MQFTLNELPPTTNSSFKVGRGRFYETHTYKDYKLMVRAKVQPKPLKGSVKLQVDFYIKRDCDIDGRLKCLLDALNGIYYDDDRQITELIVTKNRSLSDSVCVAIFPISGNEDKKSTQKA